MNSDLILANALQSIFDDMHAFVFLKDTNNRHIKVNARVAESHGVTPEYMAGRPAREFYGAQADAYFEDDKEVIRTGVPKLNIIEPLPIDENTTRWIETSKIPVRDSEDRVIGILVIATDVTEKREAEAELTESRNLLNTTVQNVEQTFSLYGPDKRLKFGNRAFWKMHEQGGNLDVVRIGARYEDISAAIASKVTEVEGGQDTRTILGTFLSNWDDLSPNNPLLYGQRWIHFHRYRTPEDGRVVFGYDVTESREARHALTESEKRYHTLAKIAPVGICRTNLEGLCAYANDLWHTLAGIPAGEALGRCWTEGLHPTCRAEVLDVWRDAVVDEGTFRTECRVVDHEGVESWILVTITTDRGKDGTPIGFICCFTDISRQKQVEMQLRDVQQDLRKHRDQLEALVDQRTADLREAQQSLLLRERLAAIGQLTATVSHELRNPLGTIVASFEALKRRIDLDDEKLARTAARIDRNVKRCETIIEDLLNYTRVKTLNCETVNLDAWLIQFLSDNGYPEAIRVRTHLKAGSNIRIDKVAMSQVISNLLANAIDSMSLQAKDDQDDEQNLVEIQTGVQGDELKILVSDSGAGLARQDLERVFEPLISTKTFGVGLGLPLVRQIVELHGGRVEIRNRETGGAEVEVVLPLDQEQSARATERA